MAPLAGRTDDASLSAPDRRSAPLPALATHSDLPSRAGARTRVPSLGLLVVLLIAITALRIVALAANGTDLFVDQAQYWAWSRDLAFGYYSKPPLIAWIISGSTAVCGDGEFCVRLPSPLIHGLTSILVYLIGL